ncbi:MAG TPA: type II secretion system protein [bacterium]|nr:type II secretion system protein [bacterium]
MRTLHARGFTLVEVLAVASLVGLVSSMILLIASGMSRQTNDMLRIQYAQHETRQIFHDVARDFRNAESTDSAIGDYANSDTTLVLSDVGSSSGVAQPAVVYSQRGNRCWRTEFDSEGAQKASSPVTPENMLARFEKTTPNVLKITVQWVEPRGQSSITRSRSVLVAKR